MILGDFLKVWYGHIVVKTYATKGSLAPYVTLYDSWENPDVPPDIMLWKVKLIEFLDNGMSEIAYITVKEDAE